MRLMTRQPTHQLCQLIILILQTINIMCSSRFFKACNSQVQQDVEIGSFSLASRETMLTVKIRQPSHEFTFGVGMNFIPYPLVLTPVV
jgi:hypothetical protein